MKNVFFKEPRLEMTIFGRFVVRLAGYAAYSILIVGTIVLLVSEIPWLRSIGVLTALFLIDRVIDVKKARRPLGSPIYSNRRVNLADFLTPAAYKVIERSLDQVTIQGGDPMLYVLKNLVERKEIRKSLWRLDINPAEFEQKLDEHVRKSLEEKFSKKETLKDIEAVVFFAFEYAKKTHGNYIEPRDLLAGVGRFESSPLKRIFTLFEITESDLEYALLFSRAPEHRSGEARPTHFIGKTHRHGHRVMNRAWTARPTYILDKFSTDLTELARHGHAGLLVGHQNEYGRLEDVLARPNRPNALLVGEPGSGKEAVMLHFAFNIVRDRVPKPLFDKRLISLEIGSLVAGATEGELEKRVKTIIQEIIDAGNIILYVPDIHNLLRTSEGGRITAADVFIPAIKEGLFAVVGATYPREFKEYIEPAGDFLSIFEAIKVEEITEAEAIQLITYESVILEKRHKIIISLGAIKEAVRIAHKYFREKLLPGSAADLLHETLADAIMKEKKTVLADDVVGVAEKRINVPIRAAGQEETEKLLNLEALIHERLVDQAPAVTVVARALREYRSGLSKPGKPIATFLFVGPTGVGKTELSKILARIQFGSENFMVRLDMSEYQNQESVFQLLGSPKGEVRGTLTEAIRAKPYSLILLDEFEKAHPEILNIFLAVFDDGRLTDNLGRVIDFQHTIIIATSNAHSEFIKSEIERGNTIDALGEIIKGKLTDYFKPELLNRFSDIIVFKSLSPQDIHAITELALADLARQIAATGGIKLEFDESAVAAIAKLGYDPVFGARPLKKVISERIKSVLAEQILRKEIIRGDTVKVLFVEDVFQAKKLNSL